MIQLRPFATVTAPPATDVREMMCLCSTYRYRARKPCSGAPKQKDNGMFDANGNHKIGSKVVFAHVSKHMGRQDGECDICGTIDGRSGDFNSLKGRSVPCYGRDGACTHPSPPHSLFRKIPKYDFSPKMCVQFKFL